LAILATGLIALTVAIGPQALAAPTTHLTDGTARGAQSAVRVSGLPMKKMPNCTPAAQGDYAHMSATPGDVSAHGWWTRGTCSRASVATVSVTLQEEVNGTWTDISTGTATIPPGKIPVSQRANARATCHSNTATYWRSHVIAHVSANGDVGSDDNITTKQQLPCHV
jgi:hypothetical protein